ncbi:protein NLRC5-like [Lytechinus pictus]|uniref:protein NLRC5-like n=1 Tax=Lytechinus pictus TaxID=7653 RepID=UPI0030B9D379
MSSHGGITDELLCKLAEHIETGEQMEALARTLGFNTAAINRYIETSRLEGRVTCKGTRDMMFDWRQRVDLSNQHPRLKQALIDARLIMLAETYLNDTLTTQDIYSEKISESLTVRKCRTILEDKYSNQLCKIQMKPWDKDDYAEFEDMHTVVTIVKKDARGRDITEKQILQGSVGKIFSAKVNGKFPSRILISAPAGRGKTTAVAKMAHNWVHREEGSGLEDLPLLFVVKFRNTSHSTSIGEAIISQLLSDVDDLTPEGLESFIREHQGICHIVLDGLDEYAGISSSSNIMRILRWEMFQQCRVLVTTRPHLEDVFSKEDLPRVYTKMEIEGFSRESTRDYIDMFFTSVQKPMKANGLKCYLAEHPLIEELVKTPLFCLMVCHLWSEDLLHREISTQTAILDKVNVFLMHHANERTDGLFMPETLDAIIHKLGKVALTGLLNDSKKLVFTPRDFQKIPSALDMACELGIVSKTTVSTARLSRTNKTNSTTIEFYHKLAQEHAAGKFLADKTSHLQLKLKISQLDRVLRKIKRNIGEYENLIRFAAGSKNSLCIRIMETLLTNKYLSESERYRILLDCSSESGVSDGNVSLLVQRCVTSQSILLRSPTIYTAVGMQNLPSELKQKVLSVKFENSVLTTVVTEGLWRCLKSFTMLSSLTISDSSIDFPPSPTELPSIRSLSVEGVTSQCYKGLISTLPGLTDMIYIDVTIDDSEEDIAHIVSVLLRTGGQKLERIIIRDTPSSFPSRKRPLWSETEGGLRLLFDKSDYSDTATNMLILQSARHMEKKGHVEVLESFAFLAQLARLKLEFRDGGSFNFERTFGVKVSIDCFEVF